MIISLICSAQESKWGALAQLEYDKIIKNLNN
jgi:hypothetical protein